MSDNALYKTRYLMTVGDSKELPEAKVEVAFVGRSNVGKSSTINAICRAKKLAYSSQFPGKTRTINIFEVKRDRWIVDLPGYGYASTSKVEREQLAIMVENYIINRKSLACVFVIIDAVAGPTERDLLMCEWLIDSNIPFNVIVNKIDKIKPSKIEGRKKEIAFTLNIEAQEIFWISAEKSVGVGELRRKIVELLGIQ